MIYVFLYFFARYYWTRSRSWDGISMRKIRSIWPGINKVDAAYEYKKTNTVILFTGTNQTH